MGTIKTIYWKCSKISLVDKIRRRFNITSGMSVNGESNVEVNSGKDAEDLQYLHDHGYIEIRNKKNYGTKENEG